MSCEAPFYIEYENPETGLPERYKVPCGKCQSCLRSRRSQWTVRLYHEYLNAKSAWFVTLTYDDLHLPLEGVNKDDVQKFFKKFRKKQKCRFFLVSEYGDTFGRPHYHCIFFFPDDVSLVQCVRLVDQTWQNGNIQVGEVTLASINYCSKYALKDRYDHDEDVLNYPNKTFTLMSRRPGIGASWLDSEQKKILKEDQVFELQLDGLTYNLPRYYRDKIFSKPEKLKHQIKIQEKYDTADNKERRDAAWLYRAEHAADSVLHRNYKPLGGR